VWVIAWLARTCFVPSSFAVSRDAHSHVTPPSYLGTAAGAGDGTVICRMVWDDKFIAAALALAAAKGGLLVPLDRLSHGIASVRMGKGPQLFAHSAQQFKVARYPNLASA